MEVKGDESMELEKDQLGPLNKRLKHDPSLQPTMESVREPLEAVSKSICEPSIQPPSDHSSDSGVTDSPSLRATMESVTESAEAISKFPCESSIQQPSDSDSDSDRIILRRQVVRKVFLSYPDWNSKEVLMKKLEKLKSRGLDLDKVAQDFDALTPPESPKNIIFRFIYYDDKSYAFAWIEKVTDEMKAANPRNNPLWKRNGSRRIFKYDIPVYDPTIDINAFGLILDDVEECYWPMVLRKVLRNDGDYFNSMFGDNYNGFGDHFLRCGDEFYGDEYAVKFVNEDAVQVVNEDANEDDEIKYKDGFDLQEIRMSLKFKLKDGLEEFEDDDGDGEDDNDKEVA